MSCQVYPTMDASLLTEENQAIIQQHTNLPDFVKALQKLSEVHLLNQASFTILAEHIKPHDYSSIIAIIKTNNLTLSDDNYALLQQEENIQELNESFQILHEAGLLTQININHIFSHVDILLVHAEENATWNRIPAHRLTQGRLNQIIQLCENHRENINAGRRAFINYVNELLGITPGNVVLPEFNATQSTHTASVHKSVSSSATRLYTRYGQMLTGNQLKRTIKQITTWGKSITAKQLYQKPSEEEQEILLAAKRCLPRLLRSNHTPFTDPRSNINIHQLIAICWKAIHDEPTRCGTLLEGKKRLINGLYEIQRDGNISELGLDNGQRDSSICASGTFNKFIDTFVGFHPDFNIINITLKTASNKLPCVVKDIVTSRLLACKNSNPEQYTALCNDLKENDVAELWPDIVNEISDAMYDEFHSIFPDGKESENFKRFIDPGKYTDLSELPMLEENPPVQPRV